jgi:hypothetical protein
MFESVRFLPRFTLLSKERNLVMDAQILQPALEAIAARERVTGKLFDHVEIARQEIPLSNREEENSVWGVATWTDVDPMLNFFAIEVRGLTNAYQINVNSGVTSNSCGKRCEFTFGGQGIRSMSLETAFISGHLPTKTQSGSSTI